MFGILNTPEKVNGLQMQIKMLLVEHHNYHF